MYKCMRNRATVEELKRARNSMGIYFNYKNNQKRNNRNKYLKLRNERQMILINKNLKIFRNPLHII